MYFSSIDLSTHLYWNVGSILPFVYTKYCENLHAETLLIHTVTMTLSFFVLNAYNNLEFIPRARRVQEGVYAAAVGVAKGQLGEYEFRPWLPLISTMLCLIILANWTGALCPWKLVTLPSAELKTLTTDPNTTLVFAAVTSFSYFYAGISTKGIGYFARYVSPSPVFLPINILEDFTKPLSLSFRLFGNLLADEIIVSVLLIIYPYLLPVPLMLNGLSGATLQGVVFSTLTASYIIESIEVIKKISYFKKMKFFK